MPAFAAMPFAAQFIVWGMRCWVVAYKRQAPVVPEVAEAFRKAGAEDAWPGLDDLFGILAVAATRPLDIRCVGCRLVSPDELALLDLLAVTQRGDVIGVAGRLAALLPPAAARLAIDGVEQCAHGLRSAGMHLAVPGPLAPGPSAPGSSAPGPAVPAPTASADWPRVGSWPALADAGIRRMH